jgi:hypothetical protein
MRVMVLVKGDESSEHGRLPTEQELAEMTAFNEQLSRAGIMLAGEGLRPSSKGVRIRFDGASRSVVDGPFSEAKELVAGYWLWQVRSLEEAIEWLKRAPFREGEVEIRPVFEDDDFGDAYTPELREREQRLREAAAQRA